MVLYGVYAEVSIGKLFMAGFLPGLLSAALYILMIVARVKLTPDLAGKVEQHFTSQEKWEAIKEVWALPTLIIFVLGESLLAFSHRQRPGLLVPSCHYSGGLSRKVFADKFC